MFSKFDELEDIVRENTILIKKIEHCKYKPDNSQCLQRIRRNQRIIIITTWKS